MKDITSIHSEDGESKSQQAPRKSHIFKKENEDHREEKRKIFFFLSKWGYFEGNLLLFFSFPTLCRLISILMELIFFSPTEAFLCAVCFVPPNLEQSDRVGLGLGGDCASGPGGPAAGRKPQGPGLQAGGRQACRSVSPTTASRALDPAQPAAGSLTCPLSSPRFPCHYPFPWN